MNYDDQPGFPSSGSVSREDPIFSRTTGARRFTPSRPPRIVRKQGDPPVIFGSVNDDPPSARGGTKAIALDPRSTATNVADIWQARRVVWVDLTLNENDEFETPTDRPRDRVIIRIEADPDVDRLREGVLSSVWDVKDVAIPHSAKQEAQKASDRLSVLHSRTHCRIRRQLESLAQERDRASDEKVKTDLQRRHRRLTASAYLLDALGEDLYEKQKRMKVSTNPAVDYDWRKAATKADPDFKPKRKLFGLFSRS